MNYIHSTESSSYLDPNKLGHSLHHWFDSLFTNIKQFITVVQADIVLDKLFLFHRGAIRVSTVCFNRFWYYDFEGKMTYNHLKVTWLIQSFEGYMTKFNRWSKEHYTHGNGMSSTYSISTIFFKFLFQY